MQLSTQNQIQTQPSLDLNQRAKNKLVDVAHQDFFKHAVPSELGGLGTSFVSLVHHHSTLGKTTQDASLVLSINAHLWGGIYPLMKFGTQSQQMKWLLPILSGDAICGHAITEPEAGSAVDGIKTYAEKCEHGYKLTGFKRYITNAPIADWLLVYAKTEEGLSAFLVERNDSGVEFITKNNLTAFKESPIGEVKLTDCFVKEDRLIGKLGAGKSLMQSALEHERAFLFAGLVGVMESQMERLIPYVRARKTNTGSLGQCQAISHKLVHMQLGINTIKIWLEHCASLKDQNKRISLPSSQLKIIASDIFLAFCQDAIQIQGAVGLETDTLSNLMLDAAACRLLSGSNEIQKNIIATLMGVV